MIKNVFKKIRTTWKSMSTKQKIDVILDAVCSIGGGMAAASAATKLTEGRGPVEKVLVRTTMAGIGIAGGNVAHKALQESYGNMIGDMIDRAKAKAAEAEKEKEAAAHE